MYSDKVITNVHRQRSSQMCADKRSSKMNTDKCNRKCTCTKVIINMEDTIKKPKLSQTVGTLTFFPPEKTFYFFQISCIESVLPFLESSPFGKKLKPGFFYNYHKNQLLTKTSTFDMYNWPISYP